jgi:hypothetical protein
VRGNQARAKNADLRHSSFTVVMQKRKKHKFASPVLNVLIIQLCNMKAGIEFCSNVLLNYRRTGITHYGGVTVRINQYLKSQMSSLKVSMTVHITATYKILPHANLTFI